jgi:uncharacterized phage-associated protein
MNTRLQNTILYLIEASGGMLDGKKKLAKLLYYVDFDRYEYKESMKSVTGCQYVAWKMGPVPVDFDRTLLELNNNNVLRIEKRDIGSAYNPTECYYPLIPSDLQGFDDDDVFIMDEVVRKYGSLTGTQLEHLSHMEAPWIGTEQNEIIEFGLTFYRGTHFSDAILST